MDFVIKQNDALPAVSAALSRTDGTSVDLTGATVHFVMRDPISDTPIVNHVATIASPVAGQVSYFWQTGDTAVAGSYNGSWVVTFPDTTRQTFPTEDYLEIVVQRDLSTTGPLATGRPTDGVRPPVSAIGALLPKRGMDRTGVQFGPNGATPNYIQVQQIIDTVAGDIDGELGGVSITPELASLARYCITLASAATVELSYFPEQASSSGDTSAILWSRYQLALTRFRALLAQEGGGPGNLQGGAGLSPTLSAVRTYNAAVAAGTYQPFGAPYEGFGPGWW